MTHKAKKRMKRSNSKWETFELAMIRTAVLRIEAGESMHQQIEWLYGNHIQGRTRSAIRSRIQRMTPKKVSRLYEILNEELEQEI